MPFAAGLASFAGFMVLAGRWQDKVGPKMVATTGGVVLGAGIILAGLAPNIYILTLAYGIIGGAGIGLAYVCPIAALVKWFPDKKGLISGVAVAGFGAGALIIAQVANAIMAVPVPADELSYLKTEAKDLTNDDLDTLLAISDEDDDSKINDLVLHAEAGNLTDDDNDLYTKTLRNHIYEKFDWSKAFYMLGIVYLICVVFGAQTLRNPPEGYRPKGWKPPAQASGKAPMKVDYKWNEMMKTSQYWLLWLMFVLGATAGLMVIGNIGKFAAEASIGAAQIATIIGVLAIFNGAGRVVWGAVSDKIGRPSTLLAMYVISGIFMAILFNMQEFLTLMVGASMIGFCFGGNFAMYPSATADFFGTKNVGLNYGLVFTAYGVAGIVGAVVAGFMVQITGSYYTTFIIMAVICFVAAGLSLIIKPPQAQRALVAKKSEEEE